MKQSGIYQFRCIVNDNKYIGSAFNLKYRKNNHLKRLKLGKHNKKFQKDFIEFKEESFEYSILEYVPMLESESKKEFKLRLIKKEQHYLDTILFASEDNNKFYKLAYNILRKADSTLGYLHTIDAIKEIGNRSREYYKTHDGPNKGKNLSREVCDNISKGSEGKPKSKEHIENMHHNHSIETIEKLSIAGINEEKFECPYCYKFFKAGLLEAWHGDNCKENPNITQLQLDKRKQKRGICIWCKEERAVNILKIFHNDNCKENSNLTKEEKSTLIYERFIRSSNAGKKNKGKKYKLKNVA